PAWFCDELVATDIARTRLQRWCDGGGLEQPRLGVFDIRERIAFIGDEQVMRLAAAALWQLAPPVTDHVLDTAVIVGIGKSSAGMVAPLPTFQQMARAEFRLILLDGGRDDEDIVATMAHEAAH